MKLGGMPGWWVGARQLKAWEISSQSVTQFLLQRAWRKIWLLKQLIREGPGKTGFPSQAHTHLCRRPALAASLPHDPHPRIQFSTIINTPAIIKTKLTGGGGRPFGGP